MSADTTPVILITNGEKGLEYRIAVAQAWENAWDFDFDAEGEVLDAKYVASVFERSPVVATTLEAAREALKRYIEDEGYIIEYEEEILDLSVTSEPSDLEKYLGITPQFTYQDLVFDTYQVAAAGA